MDEPTKDIPRDQEVCPKCGATCNYDICECPYECFTSQERKL